MMREDEKRELKKNYLYINHTIIKTTPPPPHTKQRPHIIILHSIPIFIFFVILLIIIDSIILIIITHIDNIININIILMYILIGHIYTRTSSPKKIGYFDIVVRFDCCV